MQYNHGSRFTLIAVVLIVALIMIFPPTRWFDPGATAGERINLKPGIDMVGGTSLLYEIKPPEEEAGTYQGQNLAEQVMNALKRRVDPDGVKNLVWRPQGNTRLEIQMPRTARSGDAEAARAQFAEAQAALEATNVRRGAVVNAVEQLQGEQRTTRLNELAMGDPARSKLFADLAATFDRLKAARSAGDADAEARASIEYDKLRDRIDETNLPAAELQTVLDAPEKDRQGKLDALKASAAAFPARAKAIEQFAGAYGNFTKYRGSLDDAGELKRLLQGSGVLEWYILASGDELQSPAGQQMIERLQGRAGIAPKPGDTMRWMLVDQPEQFGYPTFPYNGKSYALVWTTPEKSMTARSSTLKWGLERAGPENDGMGGRAVGFRFDPEGARLFAKLTGANINKPLAAVLDGRVISAANINNQIGRTGIITRGNGYTTAEFDYLINTLNAGSLPARLADEPIMERTVGPQLGRDNLVRGLLACALGLGVVSTFLIIYYRLAGAVAAIALVLNLVLVCGTMAALNATFTLPGVAGVVLTIGAAVDANVLVFERLREEQARGLPVRMALKNAYSRASSAIVDSNATTVITSLILVWLGTEEVKGFGLTLLIGLVWSLFTSLFVTRTIFDFLVDRRGVTRFGSLPMSYPAWERFLHPNIQWMDHAWKFATFSALFAVLGVTAFVVKLRSGELLDIEFARGTAVQVELKQPIPIDEVRRRIEEYAKTNPGALPSPAVVEVGTGEETKGRAYEIITPNDRTTDVRKAIPTLFGNDLNVDIESRFEGVNAPLERALGSQVVPIEGGPVIVNGWTVPQTADYRGGAAIVLKDIAPPLSPEQIESRMKRQQLQPTPDGSIPAYSDFTVVGENRPTDAGSTAVVLVAPGDLPYDQDQGKWREAVVAPMWDLVNVAVNKPATLQSVRSFDPSVAGDTQQAALGALALSVFVIMAYIWLRFGNLRYGTATVIAMLHDTLLAVGAIGLAHYFVAWLPGLAAVLLLEPFRLNLTLVAAVLTTMSYSMIDTIVVFDRVRENRGKYGHLSRRVVNDSINQTLSRTLLTLGTTAITLFGMYVAGGSGIHGFTFVLLVGIIVGSYSSIAVAAPFLLMGADAKAGEAAERQQGAKAAAAMGQRQLQQA